MCFRMYVCGIDLMDCGMVEWWSGGIVEWWNDQLTTIESRHPIIYL